ncbi:PEP-CTERM sorting domain-containing protein [Salinimonas chungwhensis]|uniref:PEP-CTERM sorting domain-containing protein n=1 Tax=Salinimonas chungwhensis TaxID=265425 RepID=UPI00036CB681|nr:PEP-CTERM sorting domain-containing protein [Salinimonas chungwhensis]
MKNLKTLIGAAALLVSTLGTSLSANAAMITQEGRINGESIFNLSANLDEDALDSAIENDPFFDPTEADNFFNPEIITLTSLKLFGESVDLGNVFQFDVVFNALDLSRGFDLLTLDFYSEALMTGLSFEFDRAFSGSNLATFYFPNDPDSNFTVFGDDVEFSVVPEPSAFAVFALAMGLMMVRRQRS